ncbi:YrbL family protein [uncultured Tateyamaria sp.]|uniref:YrbL family protein n=1 Tax=uncultured Tateyamaria sp. TaxID=455651 RepID=UPI002612BAB8|nr:YrbL family protein [uncultured Tateyamaria sp.]
MTNTDTTAGLTILKDYEPIANGEVRDVWHRPGHPDQLLKTIRTYKREKYERRRGLRRALDYFRMGPYGTFRIEYRCYLKTAYRCAQQKRPLPIAEMGGLVITDRGLAQVCEKIADASGNVAQTLEDVLREGPLSDERLKWLNDFVANIFALNVNVPDLRPSNIALDEVNRRFVVIDGYGDKTLIPIRSWLTWLNQKHLDYRFSEMEKHRNLKWSSERQIFTVVHPAD